MLTARHLPIRCAEFGFRNARRHVRRSGGLKALRSLERVGCLELPAPRTAPGPRRTRAVHAPVAQPQAVPNELGQIVDYDLVLVTADAHRTIWNGLIEQEHPRGRGAAVGCQLRYLIGSAHGWLAEVGVSAAALQLASRDRWLGWDAELRGVQLHRVIGLSRFLIRPGVRCRNLASHIRAGVLRRLGADFESRYGYRRWLAETFVEPPHTGVSLRAATWRYLGESCGRGRQDRDTAAGERRKAIYVYELEADWRTRLGVGGGRRRRSMGGSSRAQAWMARTGQRPSSAQRKARSSAPPSSGRWDRRGGAGL